MAKFSPKKFDINSINNGNKYELGDSISPSAINAPIEAAALLQSLATNAPDVSGANRVGRPSVEIGGTENSPRFVFQNLKGDKGDKGEVGERGASGTAAVLENENHDSDTDGYTQRFINRNFCNPNLLINGNFRVNQRGQTTYKGYNIYTVDRWKSLSEDSVFKPIDDGIEITVGSYNDDNEDLAFVMKQDLEIPSLGGASKITASISIKQLSAMFTPTLQIFISINGVKHSSDWIEREGIYSLTVDLPDEITSMSVGLLGEPTTVAHIQYIKLELGEVATPLSPKTYLEELRDCEYYYRRLGANTAFIPLERGFLSTNSCCYFLLPYIFRTTPTVLPNSLLVVNVGATETPMTVVQTFVSSISSNSIYIGVHLGEEYTSAVAHQAAYLITHGINGGYLEFDAEIY